MGRLVGWFIDENPVPEICHVLALLQKCSLNNWKTFQSFRCSARIFTLVKFIYSEQATKFCEIFTLLLTAVHTVISKVKILQNFVAFSEYMNFTGNLCSYKNFRSTAAPCRAGHLAVGIFFKGQQQRQLNIQNYKQNQISCLLFRKRRF